MYKPLALLTAVAPFVLLAGCGDEQAGNEAAEMNAAATAEPSGPFADAERRMSEAMMAAVGSDVGDNWARKMIEHHKGALAISEALLDQNPRPEVAEMARMTIEKQKKDIDDIEKLLKDGDPDQRSAELYRPAMMDMQQKMQAATGADASETYMRKMLEHHRGAVAMSDVALQNGVGGALREQVQKTRDENAKDAEMTEAMLRGESMSHAMSDSGAKSAEQVKAEPAVADAPRAAPKPAPGSAPKPAPKPAGPAPDPHAGHVMNNTQ